MRGGRASRRKGDNAERELVHLLEAKGFPARRVPLSGAQAGFPGDLLVCLEKCGPSDYCNHEETWQVKRMGQGFRRQYRWLQDAYALAYRGDREDWIISLRLSDLIDLLS